MTGRAHPDGKTRIVYKDAFLPMFGTPITPWYQVFAWYPIWTVDRGWRWLRTVQRRRIYKKQHLRGGPDYWNQHAVDPRQALEATK